MRFCQCEGRDPVGSWLLPNETRRFPRLPSSQSLRLPNIPSSTWIRYLSTTEEAG